MTKDQMDAYFNDLTKLEDEFLKENDGEANEHGVYVYQSPSGNHIMNLSMFLRSYRDWLIEHKNSKTNLTMTKEDITDQLIRGKYFALDTYNEAFVHDAMDEWALRFGKWIQGCNYAPATEDNKWQNQLPGENDIITTEELYQLYIKQSQ